MKKIAMISAITIAMMSASAAQAAVYTYNDGIGHTMVIDTVARTGKMTGPSLNLSFSGDGLADFTGGATPTGHYDIVFDAGSTQNHGGEIYVPNNGHQPMLVFNGTNSINIWAYWGPASNPTANVLGDYIWNTTGYTPPTTSSTSGGTTSGGSTGGGSTGGGTDVPAPGVLGLMALASMGLGVVRRRSRV